MTWRLRRSAAVLAGGLALSAAMMLARPASAEPPALVSAYAQQLVRQCGGAMTSDLASQVIQQVDLNGDKQDDWIIDAGRYPCPNRPAVFKDQGSQVTVFLGRSDGHAIPAFQRVAFGSRLERGPDGSYGLSVTLGGADCGEKDAKARCDRRLTWRTKEQRFELVDPSAKPTRK